MTHAQTTRTAPKNLHLQVAYMLSLVLLLGLAMLGSGCSDGNSGPSTDGDGDVPPDGDEPSDGDEPEDGDVPVDGDTDGDGTDEDGDIDTEPDGDTDGDQDGDEEPSYGIGLPPRPDYAPSLFLKPEDKDRILERITREPWASVLAEIEAMAAREYVAQAPGILDSTDQPNGSIALAAAFLAWLLEDADMAAKARLFLERFSDNYAGHTDGDINIRLPGIVMNYTFALDLLVGAELIPAEEATSVENKLTAIIGAFYDDYILNSINRIFINLTQNNHPIRTACSIGTVAMAFPEHPRAEEWADWAFSELSYLWGPTGHYVQEDGGVSEGSLYYRFAFAPSLALFIAWNNRIEEPRIFNTDCINRIDRGPWADHGCVDGEPFVFHNPLLEERFQSSVDWFLTLRMPGGMRPPIEDSGVRADNGSAIMAGFMDRRDLVWDWIDGGYNMSGGFDLQIPHLAYTPEWLDAQPPAWKHRVMPVAGQAVFRSGWEAEDIWLLMTAENGPVRMTVHDHVDSGSFTLAAYGEYLLIDPGYYKPLARDNARTAQAESHSLLMIEGERVPAKGLLLNFGDTDAFLKNEYIGDAVAYVEAWQPIDQSTTQRAMALLRNRYAVIFDRIDTPVTEARLHTWRLHGYAGFDSGGSFDLAQDRTRWERSRAGVDVYLASSAPDLEIVEPPYVEFYAPHVHSMYSGVGHHGVMDGRVSAVSPRFVAVVAPYRTGVTNEDPRSPLDVTSIKTLPDSVAGWEVRGTDYTDWILARDPAAPSILEIDDATEIDTDAEWIAVGQGEAGAFYLMARGSYLKVNGVDIFANVSDDVVVRESELEERR